MNVPIAACFVLTDGAMISAFHRPWWSRLTAGLLGACFGLTGGLYAASTPDVPLSISWNSPQAARTGVCSAELTTASEHNLQFYLHAPDGTWAEAAELEFDLTWPGGGSPTNAQVLVHMMDRDYLWYQKLLPGYLVPGRPNHFRVDLAPQTESWTPVGHGATWHFRALSEPREFGIKVFYREPLAGTCRLERVTAHLAQDERPPFIRNVRTNRGDIPCYGLFEVSLDLPDRYSDPFDAAQVSLTAEFETPSGEITVIDGFYGRNFYRKLDRTGEQVVPQGPPYWRIRFTPTETGRHRYVLHLRDAYGEVTWGPSTFEATPAESPGFIHVSARDPRYFEFSDGTSFFPLGHNIRSSFDSRMDQLFPWQQRRPEGTAVYQRYFESMSRHGENFAEVWTASWSLGLEWIKTWPWYRGVGQYNMRNAWELDQVMDEAARRGIYINLVLNNHGKFSTFSDEEWEDNPFNTKNGGYLNRPDEYFSDPRALASFRKLMRYMVARWGYHPNLFAWELWSELDLAGTKFGDHRRPEVTDWHRLMARAIKDMDPHDHMIASHVCGDYTHQSDELIRLPEIDFCPVNAYHHNRNPLHLVNLLRQTVDYNLPFNKPVIVTEFGGSHMAQGVKHLREGLHVGLWASAVLPLGGTPLFWWWQVIDEENFYPEYAALQRFMEGEDRRDSALRSVRAELLLGGDTAGQMDGQCLSSPTYALGWLYNAAEFNELDPLGPLSTSNLTVRLRGMTNAAFRVEFWDTLQGRKLLEHEVIPQAGVLELAVPPFARDIAFKLRCEPAP